MRTSAEFGFLTGTAIVLALLADFMLAPALMVLLHRKPAARPVQTAALEGGA